MRVEILNCSIEGGGRNEKRLPIHVRTRHEQLKVLIKDHFSHGADKRNRPRKGKPIPAIEIPEK